MLQELACAIPKRASLRGDLAPDDSSAVFDLLSQGHLAGLRGALLTLVDCEGGSARPVGAQMAVLEDGCFTGYLSGGCVEAALAAEALVQIERRENKVLRLGAGSPIFDIRLPCGGSIDVLIDVTMSPDLTAHAAAALAHRRAFGLALGPSVTATLVDGACRTGWHDEIFRRMYPPPLQIVVAGRGLEFEAVTRLAAAAGYPVRAFCADDAGVERLFGAGLAVTRLAALGLFPDLSLGANTALVLMFHDHEWETALWAQAFASPCRYIGAMGSRHTHRRRCEQLLARGFSPADVDRIRGPIGLFGPTRNASALAISVLAELAQLGAAT